MSQPGYLQFYAYTGNARLPLRDVAILVTDSNGSLVKMGLTDSSGRYGPIPVEVPDRSESLTPDPTERPYGTVNVHARLKNYEQIQADNIQIFAGIITNQNLEMIPLSELPDQWSKTELFNTTPQNL